MRSLSSFDQTDIGGYPHVGQGNPSGIKNQDWLGMLNKQRAKSPLAGIKPQRKPPQALDEYALRALDGNTGQRVEPGAGFGGVKELMQ